MYFDHFPINEPIRPALEAAVSRQWQVALNGMSELTSCEEMDLALHRWHFFALRSCFSHCEPLIDPSVTCTPDQVEKATQALFEFKDGIDWRFFLYLKAKYDGMFDPRLQNPRQEMRRLFPYIAKLYNQMMEAQDAGNRVPFEEWTAWHDEIRLQEDMEDVTSGLATYNL